MFHEIFLNYPIPSHGETPFCNSRIDLLVLLVENLYLLANHIFKPSSNVSLNSCYNKNICILLNHLEHLHNQDNTHNLCIQFHIVHIFVTMPSGLNLNSSSYVFFYTAN